MTPARILVVKRDKIGDLLLTTPLLEHLRTAFGMTSASLLEQSGTPTWQLVAGRTGWLLGQAWSAVNAQAAQPQAEAAASAAPSSPPALQPALRPTMVAGH